MYYFGIGCMFPSFVQPVRSIATQRQNACYMLFNALMITYHHHTTDKSFLIWMSNSLATCPLLSFDFFKNISTMYVLYDELYSGMEESLILIGWRVLRILCDVI